MKASIRTKEDGSVVMQLDPEAARATFASVQFASRFHGKIAALSRLTEQELAHKASGSGGEESNAND